MTQINLLPWREQRRLDNNKQFAILICLSFILSALAAATVWGYLYQAKQSLSLANDYLSEHSATLQTKLQQQQQLAERQQQVSSQLNQVEHLAQQQTHLVSLWSDMSVIVPHTIYLTYLNREQDVILFRGKSRQSSEVSKVVNQLQLNEALQQVEIKLLKNIESKSPALIDQSVNSEPLINKPNPSTASDNRYLDFEIVATMSGPQTDSEPSAKIVKTATTSQNRAEQ